MRCTGTGRANRGADTSLSGIVRRPNGWVEQEPKDRFSVLDQPPGQGSGLGAFADGVRLGQLQDAVFDAEHDAIKAILWNLLPQMPEVEQSFEIDQKELSKPLVGLSRQCGKEFDVSNQVGQAKLLKPIAVLDIGAEEVADNRPVVGFSEDIFKDLRASRLGDTKEADRRRAKDPYPVFHTLVLPAGFVYVQDRLGGDVFGKFFIWLGQGLADASDGVAQVATGCVDVQHFATELFEAGIAGVERTLHVGDQRLQTRAEQLSFDNAGWKLGPNQFSTNRTTICVKTVLGDLKRVLAQLGDLLNFGLPGRFEPAIVAVRATRGMEFLDAINLIGVKRRTSDTFVPRLSALTARAVGIARLGRLDDIGRWWLGGVGRVLGKRGHLLGKRDHLLGKVGQLFSELGVLLEKFSVLVGKLSVSLFEFCDPSQIELFFGRFHPSTLLTTSQPLHLGLLVVLSDVCGPPLESWSKCLRDSTKHVLYEMN